MILLLTQSALILTVFFYANYRTVKEGNVAYAILFLITYLPIYFTFQAVLFQHTQSLALISIFRYLKEVTIFNAVLIAFGRIPKPFTRPIRLTKVDALVLAFTLLSIGYAVLPIGEASIVDRLLYLKKILLPTAVYLIGRLYTPSPRITYQLLHLIMVVAVLAFVFNLFESLTGTHYHTRIGWAAYDFEVNKVEPKGHYGIGWNFEIGPNNPRFASFFANTLEASSASLMAFAVIVPLFLLTRVKSNQMLYGLVILMVVSSNYFAFSRAGLLALFTEIVLIAWIMRYYKLLFGSTLLFVLLIVGAILFAPKEMKYLIIDTLTFRQISSFGHLIEWIQAVQTMIENPFGIGIAASGIQGVEASGGVAEKVGGENQFLIYGVQLGFLGMLLHILILYFVITYAIKAYRLAVNLEDKLITFVTAVIKFGLILPLFTSNAETFLYVSLVSWWITGRTISVYQKLRVGNPDLKESIQYVRPESKDSR